MALKSIAGDPMLNLVYRTVHEYIKRHKTIPSELKHALKGSPHTKRFIKNLTGQYRAVADLRVKQGKHKLKTKTYKDTVEDMTELFLKGVEGHAQRKRESFMASYAREHADDDTKEMQSVLEGKNTGAFEDMGLIVPEDQQEKTDNHIKEPIKNGRIISLPKN